MPTDLENAVTASESAFHAEYCGVHESALQLHIAACGALEQVIHDGKVLRTEPVRRAKMQLKVHQQRREVLERAMERKTDPPFLIPSLFSARETLRKPCLTVVSQRANPKRKKEKKKKRRRKDKKEKEKAKQEN